jgi:hypothetical protein
MCRHPGCRICLIQWSHDNELHCGRSDCTVCYVRFDLNADVFD